MALVPQKQCLPLHAYKTNLQRIFLPCKFIFLFPTVCCKKLRYGSQRLSDDAFLPPVGCVKTAKVRRRLLKGAPGAYGIGAGMSAPKKAPKGEIAPTRLLIRQTKAQIIVKKG